MSGGRPWEEVLTGKRASDVLFLDLGAGCVHVILSLVNLEVKVWMRSHKSKQAAVMKKQSFLAWKIPWIEDPGRLQSMGSQSQTCMLSHV